VAEGRAHRSVLLIEPGVVERSPVVFLNTRPFRLDFVNAARSLLTRGVSGTVRALPFFACSFRTVTIRGSLAIFTIDHSSLRVSPTRSPVSMPDSPFASFVRSAPSIWRATFWSPVSVDSRIRLPLKLNSYQ